MDVRWISSPDCHFRYFDQVEPSKEPFSSIVDLHEVNLVTVDQAIEPLLNVIPQVTSILEIVKQRCVAITGRLTADESAAIMLYTVEWTPKEQSLHFILNRTLQAKASEELLPWCLYLKLIQTGVAKLPSASRRIFYRGTNAPLTQTYTDHQIFSWHGLLSCTTSLEVLANDETNFGRTGQRTLFVIQRDQGKDIRSYSFYPGMVDIFLPLDQRYQVISDYQSTDNLRMVTVSDVIQEIHSMEKPLISTEYSFLHTMDKYEFNSEISFRGKKLTDDHMKLVVNRAVVGKQCRWLSLQGNEITSDGMTILARKLSEDVGLETLHLSKNRIDDVNIDYWTKVLFTRCSRLTFLSLDQNSIGDEGAQYLAMIIKTNTTLTDLWLSSNKISNVGAQALATVLTTNNQTLLQLYLNHNPSIDDDSVTSFTIMLILNRSLMTFYIHDCHLTSMSQRRLENAVEDRPDFDLCV